jgi:hypothetical protein
MNAIKNFFASKPYKWILWVFAELLILAIVFALGIRVGLHKAKYSYQWGANYERNFVGGPHGLEGQGMPPMGPGGPMNFFGEPGGDFRNAHGLAGNIVSITDNKLVVKDNDGKENTVAVTDKTIIKSGRDDIKITDLKTNDKIVIMGKPNSDGMVEADIIRVLNFVDGMGPQN